MTAPKPPNVSGLSNTDISPISDNKVSPASLPTQTYSSAAPLSGAAQPANVLQEVGPALCAYCDFQDKDSAALLTHVMDKHREKITRPAAPVAVPAGQRRDLCRHCQYDFTNQATQCGRCPNCGDMLWDALPAPLPPPQEPDEESQPICICVLTIGDNPGCAIHDPITKRPAALAGETRTEAQPSYEEFKKNCYCEKFDSVKCQNCKDADAIAITDYPRVRAERQSYTDDLRKLLGKPNQPVKQSIAELQDNLAAAESRIAQLEQERRQFAMIMWQVLGAEWGMAKGDEERCRIMNWFYAITKGEEIDGATLFPLKLDDKLATAEAALTQAQAEIDAANERFRFYEVSAEEDLETGIDNVYVKGTEQLTAARASIAALMEAANVSVEKVRPLIEITGEMESEDQWPDDYHVPFEVRWGRVKEAYVAWQELARVYEQVKEKI